MATQTQSQPNSPLTTKFKQQSSHPPSQTTHTFDPNQIIPPDDPRRTTPLHPSLPSIKLPPSSIHLNPLTLLPFTPDDLKHHHYNTLRTQYASNPDLANKARDEAVLELKNRIEENERRTREVEREMEEKEKTRVIERKVWEKRRGEGMG